MFELLASATVVIAGMGILLLLTRWSDQRKARRAMIASVGVTRGHDGSPPLT
jgi:hypothetical protein